jgi:two-component system, NarL family, sensor kinase
MKRNSTLRRRSGGPAGPPGKTSARAKAVGPAGEVEALLRSTLDALSAHIAVLDRSGTIVAVNQAWRSFARAAGFVGREGGVGMNYLAVCERAAGESPDAAQTAEALRDIIGGRRSEFRMEYPCESPDGLRWFQLRVTRPGPARIPRIVVAHEDITEVKRAQEALARLSSRLIQVQDEERRAIARELHDTTAQNLLAITLNATRLREPLNGAGESVRRILAETVGLAEQCLQEVRTLSYLLHPPLLDEMGLASALRWFAKGFSERSGIDVDVRVVEDNGAALPREIATTLFRVAQEALSNVHRHSGSPSARIDLQRTEQAVRLDVIDRGRGLRGEIKPGTGARPVGVGVSGMRVRLEQLGGRLEIQSSPTGTCVTATLPIPRGSNVPGPSGVTRDEPADMAPSSKSGQTGTP